MKESNILKDSQIIILGVCIAVATIVSSLILSQGFLKLMKFNQQVVQVTGSAQKNIKSDLVVWRCGFSRRESNLQLAYKNLQNDLEVVRKYLQSKSISAEEMTVSQISTYPVYKRNSDGRDTNEVEAYQLNQSIEVKSFDIQKIDAISRESTELINQAIVFDSSIPSYFYTKLDELKIEMLVKATENAKLRAKEMIEATGNKIGFIRSAKMGVFQITPVTSTEVSDYGYNDTSSLDKKVMAVVSASFAIE